MKIMVKEFNFQENGKLIEGVFFYDADIINEDTVENIIFTHGCNMDNKVFKKDAPCFFLPKAQADMLRHSWVKQKIDNALMEIIQH